MGLIVRVGVANRTITPPCPLVHILIFRDFQFFFVSAFYEAFAGSMLLKLIQSIGFKLLGNQFVGTVSLLKN